MGKNLLILAAGLMVTILSGSALLADPLGPPTATLKMTQNNAGFEYEFSKIDIQATEGSLKTLYSTLDSASNPKQVRVSGDLAGFTIKNASRTKAYTKLGFGMTDDWEIFLRVGAANIKGKRTTDTEWDGDFGFSGGAGTKITFSKSEDGKLAWGTLVQCSWTKSDLGTRPFNETVRGQNVDNVIVDNAIVGMADARIDYFETQIVVGPTYKPMDGFCIYGGPVLSFLRGRVKEDITGTITPGSGSKAIDDASASWKVTGKSVFGGYIGTQIDIAKNTSMNIETQVVNGGWAVATGIVWKY